MESDFIAWLRSRIPEHAGISLGIGDDAAILAQQTDKVVVTTDMLMDGVDFRARECSPEQIGRKALAVNLSDLAAMAARPFAAFVSVAMPRAEDIRYLQRVYEGMFDLSRQLGVGIAGGDTNTWDGALAINITAVGLRSQQRGWLRGDGQPGDAIVVTGEFGGSILGKHFDFQPRVFEALELARQFEIHAATDVSDGLSLDLSHILQESNCGAVIQASRIPISAAAKILSQTSGKTPLEHALGDGEDFELVLTLDERDAQKLIADQPVGVPVHWIGRLVSEPGMWLEDESGQRIPLTPTGFQHMLHGPKTIQ